MTEPITLGELLTGRRLKQVPGPRMEYLPGQYKAKMLTKVDALVTYVDTGGAACILPCYWDEEGEEWVHRRMLVRSTFRVVEARQRPQGSPLQPEILDALNSAKARQATTT